MMEVRRLGTDGPDVGVIGLGTEHLERSQETMAAVLAAAAEAGANYVDLLYVEPDYWDAFGSLFRKHCDDLVLAVHWGAGERYDTEYCLSTFENILSTAGNGYADVAMITMIDDGARKGAGWREASLEVLHRHQQQGRVGLIGASAHDAAVASEAVRSGWLDVLMYPINMLSYDNEEDQALFRTCADHGVSLIAMKAYHGGTLFWANGKPTGITPAQCLEYVFSLPVSAAVPGPKNLEEWQATLRAAEATDEERDYRSVLGNLPDLLTGQCVYCHHCLPCPEEIEVGWVIWYVDHGQAGKLAQFREWYSRFPVKASACVECGICVERCPFDVDIMAKLAEAVAMFEVPLADERRS